jgi:hypothetical protein
MEQIISTELSNTNLLYSLKLQNHIYGCFIIMEDIAQGVVDVSGSILTTPKFTFDFDGQFNEIGIRYGFALDTKLGLDEFGPDYKDIWIKTFKDIDIARDISEVDKIEDSLIVVIQKTVCADNAFFVSALETGSLPQEWIEKLLKLVNSSVASDSVASDSDEEIITTGLSKALSEKPVKRRLSTTRRSRGIVKPKKALAKTRRQALLTKSPKT